LEKHSESRLSYLFAHLYLLSSDSFSSTLLSSNLSLLYASALLCFSSVHIVGSLTSKLPSMNDSDYRIAKTDSERRQKRPKTAPLKPKISEFQFEIPIHCMCQIITQCQQPPVLGPASEELGGSSKQESHGLITATCAFQVNAIHAVSILC
jgi:hypothetical protein